MAGGGRCQLFLPGTGRSQPVRADGGVEPSATRSSAGGSPSPFRGGLLPELVAKPVAAALQALEHRADRRMVDRLLAVVGDQILLADVSDVGRLRILREQMIERLFLRRAKRLGDRFVPFLAVREDRIDVEDHAAKIENLVANDLADVEASLGDLDRARHNRGRTPERFKRGHALLSRQPKAALLERRVRPEPAPVRPVRLPAERWLSGRKHRTRNAAYGQPYRGFESHPLRHIQAVGFIAVIDAGSSVALISSPLASSAGAVSIGASPVSNDR